MREYKDRKQWFYYNVKKPREQEYRKWLNECDPETLWEYLNLKV